jgi:hypothetical protein
VDIKTAMMVEELRGLMPALRQVPELAKSEAFLVRSLEERVSSLESRCGRGWIPQGPISTHLQQLADAAAIAAGVAARTAKEQCPTSGNPADSEGEQRHPTPTEGIAAGDGITTWPLKLLDRIEALEAAIAAGNRSEAAIEQRQPDDSQGERFEALERQLSEALTRVDALEARRDPPALAASNAQRVAHGDELRAAIAAILEDEPGATGPVVLERLRQKYSGKLPSVRTARWHLQALRGKGNTEQGEGESAPEALEESGL